MKTNRVVQVSNEDIVFDDGSVLTSDHDRDCCEDHWLSFSDLTLADFEGLEFDLSGQFFEKVEDYGIRLLPVNNFPVPVPGYGSNNGYYGSNIDLVLSRPDGSRAVWDVTECQDPTTW